MPLSRSTPLFLKTALLLKFPRARCSRSLCTSLQISYGGGRPTVSHPRNLILVGDTGQASIIETFFSLEEDTTFTNTVTEIVAGEGALVDYCKVQQESDAAFHYARVQVQQARSSSVTTHSIQLGGLLTREEVQAVLGGEGAESLLHGLYVIDRAAARGQPHRSSTTPRPTAPAARFTRACWRANRRESSTARSLSAPTRKKPIPSRATRTCCFPRTRSSTPNRNWKFLPTM